MPRTSVPERSPALLTHIPWYSDDLLCQLQTTLAALGDIDAHYEIERQRLEAQRESEPVASQKVTDLEHRRWMEREPYVQRLAEIHHRMMAAMTFQDICTASEPQDG